MALTKEQIKNLVNDYLIPGVMVLVAEKNEEIFVLLRQLGKRLEDLEAHKHDHPLEKQRKKGISYQDLSKEKKKKRHAYAYVTVECPHCQRRVTYKYPDDKDDIECGACSHTINFNMAEIKHISEIQYEERK